ncbi:acetyltransferase [Colletotrichum orchidophilum]|uniref:Acetyltransferase n=1 Tax=Colletotrichum orchidophilum TaxID=1209926 RepID=A0A1G4BM79_9PEZI|nr:acetyltransferase [Colletotrichum orchidophilum]OHF02551.1 acetyltransferase [Colletotrichum orchidophilum]
MASISAELRNQRWTRDSYLISTDASLIPVPQLNAAFASDAVYWAKAMPEAIMREMLQSSLCFGLYDTTCANPQQELGGAAQVDDDDNNKNSNNNNDDDTAEPEEHQRPQHRLIGFARLITDFVTFAYATDVWVDPALQGNGLGRWLLGCVQEMIEAMPCLRKSLLFTDSWEKSVPFYEKVMKMSVVGGQPGVSQAIMQMRGKWSPHFTGKSG